MTRIRTYWRTMATYNKHDRRFRCAHNSNVSRYIKKRAVREDRANAKVIIQEQMQ